MSVKKADDMWVPDGQPGPSFALQKLDGSRLIFALPAQHFDGTERISITIAGRVDTGDLASAQRLEQLIARNPRRRLHGSSLDRSRKWTTAMPWLMFVIVAPARKVQRNQRLSSLVIQKSAFFKKPALLTGIRMRF